MTKWYSCTTLSPAPFSTIVSGPESNMSGPDSPLYLLTPQNFLLCHNFTSQRNSVSPTTPFHPLQYFCNFLFLCFAILDWIAKHRHLSSLPASNMDSLYNESIAESVSSVVLVWWSRFNEIFVSSFIHRRYCSVQLRIYLAWCVSSRYSCSYCFYWDQMMTTTTNICLSKSITLDMRIWTKANNYIAWNSIMMHHITFGKQFYYTRNNNHHNHYTQHFHHLNCTSIIAPTLPLFHFYNATQI